MQNELKILILKKYRSEAQCAKRLGWDRQRLNKISLGKKEPSVYELNALATALDKSVSDLVPIFLRKRSPNGQH